MVRGESVRPFLELPPRGMSTSHPRPLSVANQGRATDAMALDGPRADAYRPHPHDDATYRTSGTR